MQMTMSPSAARSRSSRQSSSRSPTARTMRWPWARSPSTKRIGIDTFDRLLPSRIDGRHEHHVGVVEGVLELLHQGLEPRVAVRLHHRDHALLGALARSSENCADLGRVMGIIVDDDRAIRFADLGEAAFDTFELFEPSNYCIVGNAEFQRDGNRGQRVLDIVAAGIGTWTVIGPPFTFLVEDQRVEAACRRRPAPHCRHERRRAPKSRR